MLITVNKNSMRNSATAEFFRGKLKRESVLKKNYKFLYGEESFVGIH